MNNDVIGINEIRAIRDGIQGGLSVASITEDPSRITEFTEVTVDQKVIDRIKGLDRSVLAERVSKLSKETINALNGIILDGRFISSWKEDIPSTLHELGIENKPKIIEELDQLEISDLIDFDGEQAVIRMGIITLAVVIYAGVRIANGRIGDEPPVLDFSNIEKF